MRFLITGGAGRGAAPALGTEPAPSPAPLERSDRALDETLCWPVTRLVSWSLTLLLAVSMLLPVAVDGGVGVQWLALLLPAMLVTLGVRALFEAFGLAGTLPGAFGHLLAVLLPALIAAALMASASTIVGVHWSPAVGGATAVAATLTLATAAAARSLEIRVRVGLRRVYLVGMPESERDLAGELARSRDARLVGSSTVPGPSTPLDPGGLIASVLTSRATVLVLDGFAMRVPQLVKVASELNLVGVRIRDLASYYESEFKKVPLGEITPTWFLFDIASIHRRGLYRPCNRAVDVTLAAALLLVSLPLLLAAAGWIRLTSPDPALYRQRRVGKGGAEFTLLKLRTMVPQRDPNAPAAWALSETSRVTPIGKYLRRFRLDELPQLWNVLRGDLALVGPRPEQVQIVEQLSGKLPHYSARHCIRPGITGWAQVNLGYEGSFEGTIAKLQRDLYYVKHHSLRLDALILWLTLRSVLAGRG
jgi:lipopolysaccharide/colanic/teichoic acid biosynthesis glycosyltransferase